MNPICQLRGKKFELEVVDGIKQLANLAHCECLRRGDFDQAKEISLAVPGSSFHNIWLHFYNHNSYRSAMLSLGIPCDITDWVNFNFDVRDGELYIIASPDLKGNSFRINNDFILTTDIWAYDEAYWKIEFGKSLVLNGWD